MNVPDTALHQQWCNQRDADAFAELMLRHSSMVFSVCVRLLGNKDTAEEVAQESFIELMKVWKPISPSVAGWLHTVATRRSVDRLRADGRRHERQKRYADGTAQISEPSWDDVSGMIDQAIANLSGELRAPVVLRFLEGQSHQEIAKELGVSVSTVKRRLNTGIGGIRERLTTKGILTGAAALAAMLDAAPTFAFPTALAADIGKLTLTGAWAVTTGTSGAAALKTTATIGGFIAMKKVAVIAGVLLVAGLAFVQLKPSKDEEPIVEAAQKGVASTLATPKPEVAEVEAPVAEPEPEPAPAEPVLEAVLPTPGTISGVVVDTDGAILPTWLVIATVLNNDYPYEKGRAVTDSSGKFQLSDLEAGDYELWLQPGDQPPSIDARKHGILNKISVTLGEGEGKQGLRLVWEGTWSITGRITDASGLPLREIHVSANLNPLEMARRYNNFSTTTAEDGSYELSGMPPHDDYHVYISIRADGYLGEYRNNVKPKTEQNFVMNVKAAISGRVVSAATGEPIPTFTVRSWNTARPMHGLDFASSVLARGTKVHDPEGTFSIDSDDTGTLVVAAQAPGYRMGFADLQGVNYGETVADVIIRLEPSEEISGIVVDGSGNPIAEAMIFQGYPREQSHETADAFSLPDGTFRFSSASPLMDVIFAYRRGYAPAWATNHNGRRAHRAGRRRCPHGHGDARWRAGGEGRCMDFAPDAQRLGPIGGGPQDER